MVEIKRQMFLAGAALMRSFCKKNEIAAPQIVEEPVNENFGTCAYYRKGVIHIDVKACAAIGVAGMAWSYPGYTVDRTPYGVIQHELGHHIDYTFSSRKGAYFGDYSVTLRKLTGEDAISSYAPNDAEWFAEIFRLFVTNPDLLRRIRPKTYAAIKERLNHTFEDDWLHRLEGAPQRTIEAARKKVERAR